MQKITLTLFTLCITVCSVFAQKFNVGILLGGSNYQGDIVESQILPKETNLAYGIIARYNLTPKLDLKANFYKGKLTGNDKNFDSRLTRGYSFSTNIFEGGLNLEWNILGKTRFDDKGVFRKNRTPYIYTGIGAVSFNVAAKDKDGNDVKPSTSGANGNLIITNPEPKTFNFMIPFGAGYKFDYNEKLTFSVEVASHVPFTDYLDGFSLGSKNRDWYVFAGIGVSYLIGAKTSKPTESGIKTFQ
jgi:Domain of unknown function (DUF6089)